jgi:cytochrome c oxidase assembly factor CtaG
LALVVLAAAGAYFLGLSRLVVKTGRLPFEPWRVYAATSGFAILFTALAGPFDGFAGEAFWLHMVQHLLISLVAAPLLLLASPMPAYLWALPETARLGAGELLRSTGLFRRVLGYLTWPRATVTLFVGTLYLWHMPATFNAALENAGVHYLQHFSFFLTAVLFWWPIIGPAPVRSKLSYPQRMMYLLLVVTPTALLGSIITLSRSVIFDSYIGTPEHWGMTALEDQTMAGLIMWVPGNALYLAALTAIFFTWAAKEDRKAVTARPGETLTRRGPPPVRGGTLERRKPKS